MKSATFREVGTRSSGNAKKPLMKGGFFKK